MPCWPPDSAADQDDKLVSAANRTPVFIKFPMIGSSHVEC